MKNSEIIKRIIEKAKKNGYEIKWGDLEIAINAPSITVFELGKVFRGEGFGKYHDQYTVWFSYYDLIFDHSFAQKFWGDTEKCKIKDCECDGEAIIAEAWKHHLEFMVLESEPLKYLEKFL